jgi:hypothetical protein
MLSPNANIVEPGNSSSPPVWASTSGRLRARRSAIVAAGGGAGIVVVVVVVVEVVEVVEVIELDVELEFVEEGEDGDEGGGDASSSDEHAPSRATSVSATSGPRRGTARSSRDGS